MRYIKNILIVLALIFIAASCELKIEKASLYDEDKFVAPILNTQTNVIIDEDNLMKESITFNWKAASFGPELVVDYTLYVKYGESTARVGAPTEGADPLTFTISKNDFNEVVNKIEGFPKNVSTEISSYLEAKPKGTAVKEIQSDLIAYNVTTFDASLSTLFIPGQYQGFSIDTAPKFYETEFKSNIYNILIDMSLPDGHADHPNSFFKITPEPNLDVSWGYNELVSWAPTQTDNLAVDISAGSIFLFNVDLNNPSEGKAGTISKTDLTSVNIQGSFNGWANGLDGTIELKFEYDHSTNIWSSSRLDFPAGKLDFLIRFNGSWDYKYTLDGESVAVAGGFNLVKENGANIVVPSAGAYIMRIHGNRTPFVLVMEKQ